MVSGEGRIDSVWIRYVCEKYAFYVVDFPLVILEIVDEVRHKVVLPGMQGVCINKD